MQNEDGLSTKIWLEERENMLSGSNEPAHFHIRQFHLNPSQLKKVSKFLKEKKYSWDCIIHAAWGLLLNRICTADYVVSGSASLQMKSKDISCHSDIKAFTSVINDTITTKQFLDSIKKRLNSKTSNHSTNTSPIHYPCFIEMKSAGKDARELDINQFKLSLSFKKSEPGNFTYIYHPGFYSKHAIKSLSNYLINIIINLAQGIDKRIIDIDVMGQSEKQKILSEWTKPEYKFAKINLTRPTHEVIAEVARNHPDKLALEHNGDCLSFSEMEKKAENLAMVLIEKGVKPHNTVAVMMERTPAHIIAMLAIYKAGAVFTSINPKYPNDRIEFVIEDSQSTCILANGHNKVPEKFIDKVVVLPLDWKQLPDPVSTTPLPTSRGSDVAYMIYTSGTTGKPKGVMINHDSLSNLTSWYLNCFEMGLNDKSSQFASQGFDTFICETVPVLACGSSVHIVDDNIKLTPNLFFEWLKKTEITLCDLPTSYAHVLFAMEWPAEIKLRMMKIGGEACTKYPDKNFSFDIWNCYGPTETTVEATYYKMHQANNKPAPISQYKTPSIGKISANGETYVVDKYFQPVPVGVAGELLIGGVCVSPGYFNRDDLTKKKFIENSFNPDSSHKLYRTGDLVSWLPDGNLAFIGRIDNQIKIHGYRIELGDIENVISKHPDVKEVAVIAKEMPNGEKSIVAYVAPNLDRERYLYQERCLLSVENKNFIETITQDISKYGISISGVTTPIAIGQRVKLHLKLPGFNSSKDVTARLIWQIEERCGLVFDLNEEEQETISKSIEYFLNSHNIMDLVLSSAAKRSLRKAIRKKLPEYMVPTAFVTLPELPHTFSGKVDLKALPQPSEYEGILSKQYIPPKSETEKVMTKIWEELLNKENISMQDSFFELGGNSLKVAELTVRLMDHFGKSIPAKILFDLSYIPILSEYIDSDGNQYSQKTVIQDDIHRDSNLPESIASAGSLSPNLSSPENILLTGAGGFLGIFMLDELLSSTSAKIYCIIRKGEFETAAKRLNVTVEKFGLGKTISLSNRRIIAIPGDLDEVHFGLPLEQYNSLANKIDLIYHCGAQVNIMASYNQLRGSNVQGTMEIIKFATNGHDKPIHYISTLSSAYLKDQSGALSEDFPTATYEDLFGGYAISKWVSERLLTQLKDRGCPVIIYRSGYIAGDSNSGITSLNDALLMLIKGCIELGYAPNFNEKITILPVNFVSKAIIKISLFEHKSSEVIHVDHPKGIMWTDLIAWLNNYGYNIKIISIREWKSKLRQIDQSNALYAFLPYYLALPDDYSPPNVITEKATAILDKMGIKYPEIDDKLLNTYFDYLCAADFFMQPAKKKSQA